MIEKQYYVYVLGNIARTVLYVGVTNNLFRRVGEHKQGIVSGFTQKYKVHDLLFYESYNSVTTAIEREKQLKSWKRKSKEELVLRFNPGLEDLYGNLL